MGTVERNAAVLPGPSQRNFEPRNRRRGIKNTNCHGEYVLRSLHHQSLIFPFRVFSVFRGSFLPSLPIWRFFPFTPPKPPHLVDFRRGMSLVRRKRTFPDFRCLRRPFDEAAQLRAHLCRSCNKTVQIFQCIVRHENGRLRPLPLPSKTAARQTGRRK